MSECVCGEINTRHCPVHSVSRADDLQAAHERALTGALSPQESCLAAIPDLLAVVRALDEIARMGVVFDAKGTRARQINDIARDALAVFEAGGKERGT